jgi:arabinogalactan oligomer/maltooligosaccharide transport system substrate-binding protein
MKTSKYFFSCLLVLLIALSGLQIVAAQDGPALVMWSQDGEDNNAIFADLFTQWAADNMPGATLEVQSIETEELRNQLLTAGLAGSGLPDLVLGPNDPIGVFVDAGLLRPLDDDFDLSVYNGTLAAAQLGGQTYGIPINSGNHLMLMYNKSLVDSAPETWDDLISVAKGFTGDVQGFAYNLNEPFWFLPFVGGFGGQVFDADGNFVMDTQAWTDAYQFVHDLKYVDGVVPSECDYDCADGLFKEGNVAMILNGDWSIGTYLDTEQSPALGPDNLGIAPWPLLPDGGRPTPYTSGKFISIPVTVEGDNLDAAIAFTTWLSTDTDAILAHAIGTGRLPALTSAYDLPEVADDPILAASAAALATGIGMPANIELRCMWDAVRPSLEGVESDSLSAADATTEAQDAAESCVQDLG